MLDSEKEGDTSDYFYRNGDWYWHDRPCKGADNMTFAPQNNVWAMDCHGVFRQEKRLRCADPQSCKVLNLLFAKDAQQVYYIQGTASDIADVSTFEVLDAGGYMDSNGGHYRRLGYARDSRNVYVHDFFSGKPKILKGADHDSFERLAYGFARDAKNVWRDGTRIVGAERDSFEILSDLYSKDSRSVYYGETRLPDADPTTFRILGKITGADERNVYWQRNLIDGADRATYEADPEKSSRGKDAHSIYEAGKAVLQRTANDADNSHSA